MDYYPKYMDQGPKPCVINVERTANSNRNYRTTVWTGCHLQMTVMNIPVHGDIGLEMHDDVDQFIRIEQGEAMVRMGNCKKHLDFHQMMCKSDAAFVPAGTWHNVINTGHTALKISTIYAPPNHPRGTVHLTKEDAEH